MIVVPLGIASATPTAIRHLPAVALWREGSVFLFAVGGTFWAQNVLT